MTSVRSDGAAISVKQALLILIKKYKKNPEALKELQRLYHSGVKNAKDKKLLAKWLDDPILHSDTAPLRPVAKGKDVLKHGSLPVSKAHKKEAQSSFEEKGWNIAPLSVSEYFDGFKRGKYLLPVDAEFTNLKFALRDMHEIAEIAAATGEGSVQKLVTYPLQRMALFETVAFIETELRCQTDEDLLDTVKALFRGKVKPLMKTRRNRELQASCLQEARQLAEQAFEAFNEQHPYGLQARRLYETIYQRYESGKYTPSSQVAITDPKTDRPLADPEEAIQEITIRALSDQIYKERAQARMIELVEPVLREAIQDQEGSYQLLSTHERDNRHSFMLSGAPACGKGTIAALVADYARDKFDIEWDDVAKINTDVHRQVVSHENVTGSSKEISAHLNGDEANLITQRAYSRMVAKIKAGRAPHMLMDGADPSVERMEIGTHSQGCLHLFIVTAPVSVSIERAYQRGLSTGRYVLTRFMLGAHQRISEQLFPRLGQFQGKNLEFFIFDTHVSSSEPPKLLLGGDMEEGVAEVYDREGMAKFYAKRHINLNSKNPFQLFKAKCFQRDEGFSLVIQEAGLVYCEVSEAEATMKAPSLEWRS